MALESHDAGERSVATFDDFLDAARRLPERYRLLLVFLAASKRHGDDELETCWAEDMPLDGQVRFAEIARRMRGVDVEWEFVMVTRLTNPDGSLPCAEEAELHLQHMTVKIMEGGDSDLSGYVAFDRCGRLVADESPNPHR